ncbi:MAG: hypothetical protein HY006_00210 [Candidatus Sungbacteria bacterium]|nr:hypothetical protein [Candidatus Sungbacteria bacterium]
MPRFLEAVLLLSGMIIGVGMFAIPFSFVQTGFWPGIMELSVLACVVTALHLLYGEIVTATPKFHRMPGYIRTYLGKEAAGVSWISTLFGTIGTLLAYLIVGSLFLQTILARVVPNVNLGLLAAGLTCIVGLITFFPLRKESAINGMLTLFEIAFITGLSLLLLPKVSFVSLGGMHLNNLFFPYGVLLFSLSGGSVIPDLVTILGRNKMRVRGAIVLGSLIPAVLYGLFAFAVVGVTGSATSTEAIAGLERVVGGNIAFWASAAGFLAVLTSFIALSKNFQALLSLDMGLRSSLAWVSASIIPFALYLAGFRNFIAIIGIVGVVAFGVDGILFLLMGRNVRRRQGNRSPVMALVSYVILAVIVIGVVAELARFLNGGV